MDYIIAAICLFVLFLFELLLYMISISTILPKCTLWTRYTLKKSNDRGVKKYIYPNGRGVAYEPHPKMRKYINRYLLFTDNGYKYIKCKLDKNVNSLNYSVVMFNNQNKIIDVIDVNEKIISGSETKEILIHQDTSYASLVLNSVNGEVFDHEPIIFCRMWNLLLYGFGVSAVSLFQLWISFTAVNEFLKSTFSLGVVNVGISTFIVPSLIIGILAGAIAYVNYRAKGIRWTK